MEIPIEKQWAQELDQQEFEGEFMRRNPFGDVIPKKDEWMRVPMPVYHGVTPIQAEQYEDTDNPGALMVNEQEKKPQVYVCRGCGRETGLKAGWMRHEMYCKAARNVRTISNG